MTITTNLGAIEVDVNTAKAPCTAASMTYLASKNFYDGTKCHRLTTEGIKVPRNFNLDPSGKWMLVASQDGDNVAVFQIGDDGLPKPTGNTVKVGRPVCVKFVPVG